ncbi:nitrate reductase subunit alpha [Lactiplantibacillus plantarum]|nr:nitrate reductase subunit alpha [Lactiplantibacillus plantarum]
MHTNPLDAWASIVEDPEKTKLYKSARGHGGMVRVHRPEVLELISAMLLYTIKTYGPDRLAGFTPIPAMSMISYASGARFMSLLGGEMLSFYDWYADLPPASPQIWGEQTDVPESADWYNSQYIMMWGSNVPLTRTPDAHFMTEARYHGAKIVAVSPDYAENVKFADNWLAPNPGSDAALAQGMTHVILQEFYQNRQTPEFLNYAKQYTDLPFMVMLKPSAANDSDYTSGRFVRISDLQGKQAAVNAEWKPVVFDQNQQQVVVPNGTIGQRWEAGQQWNLTLKDADGNDIDPQLTINAEQQVVIDFPTFDADGNGVLKRHVPVQTVTFADGQQQLVTTVYELMLAQYGIDEGTHDELAASGYDDVNSRYTPAWQETVTGVKASLVVQIAREFAQNALDTGGKTMVIMGAGINHWFNSDMTYRSIINNLMLCGCEGVSGGAGRTMSAKKNYGHKKAGVRLPLPMTGKQAVPGNKMGPRSSTLLLISGNTMNSTMPHRSHQLVALHTPMNMRRTTTSLRFGSDGYHRIHSLIAVRWHSPNSMTRLTSMKSRSTWLKN